MYWSLAVLLILKVGCSQLKKYALEPVGTTLIVKVGYSQLKKYVLEPGGTFDIKGWLFLKFFPNINQP